MQAHRMSHLRLSNMEVLVAVVDDGTVLAAGADVANTLNEGSHDNHHTTNTDTLWKLKHCI